MARNTAPATPSDRELVSRLDSSAFGDGETRGAYQALQADRLGAAKDLLDRLDALRTLEDEVTNLRAHVARLDGVLAERGARFDVTNLVATQTLRTTFEIDEWIALEAHDPMVLVQTMLDKIGADMVRQLYSVRTAAAVRSRAIAAPPTQGADRD